MTKVLTGEGAGKARAVATVDGGEPSGAESDKFDNVHYCQPINAPVNQTRVCKPTETPCPVSGRLCPQCSGPLSPSAENYLGCDARGCGLTLSEERVTHLVLDPSGSVLATGASEQHAQKRADRLIAAFNRAARENLVYGQQPPSTPRLRVVPVGGGR